jgi:hypothetical protein
VALLFHLEGLSERALGIEHGGSVTPFLAFPIFLGEGDLMKTLLPETAKT